MAAERAAAAAPLTSEEARQQAQAERLTLRVANNGLLRDCHLSEFLALPVDFSPLHSFSLDAPTVIGVPVSPTCARQARASHDGIGR